MILVTSNASGYVIIALNFISQCDILSNLSYFNMQRIEPYLSRTKIKLLKYMVNEMAVFSSIMLVSRTYPVLRNDLKVTYVKAMTFIFLHH
jgi:hypothetical protein